ncbi:MAG: hypothetical protein ABJH07_00230 [Sedimentitalea sp.]|uniref:hypothetical protein n=1 Tax=Sedimentitalea sp. TaxID=2048915 RepID=UPI0032669018
MSEQPKEISSEVAAREFGVNTLHEKMPNGESRFRLTHSSGNGYILTIAGSVGAWQKSHSHHSISEVYVVEEGWIAFARLPDREGEPEIQVFGPGSVVQSEPDVPHNVYLPISARIHTVKVGSREANDWFAEPILDAKVLHLREKDLLACKR